jgi:hypothetical protein
MKYLLLIYLNEQRWREIGDGEHQQIYAEFGKLRAQLTAEGRYLGGSQLEPTNTAANVRVRDGKGLVTDGPFAETHEQLGGYFLIDVSNRAEAIAVAKQIPIARTGTIEVRALVEHAAQANA